ncbi:ribonuclease III [Arcanobacterium pinnipediorum]|uniref:Ribonuclease 3 n=1 Tax=Arcanobacterium pinnipediorum TaxID=1503041 RepID=A0ABY5AHW0_9ACTO|nr:ribonuclease III [Arcanobacterium pinnipediorum]USR78839.1 ribonuclease III [Arcanobacterium pinnipediorum]
MHEHDSQQLLSAWGVQIPQELLILALTHRSWAYEHGTQHNERLEFLGDSILGAVVAEQIFHEYPEKSEGELSKIKSAAVSERALADIARSLNLGSYIRLGKGEEQTGGREKDSILSDTVESLIAATYEACGIDVVIATVRKHLHDKIIEATHMGPALDWRTAMEEKARELGITGDVTYQIDGQGPDHAKVYTARVFIADQMWGSGQATSRKAAKLAACQDAYHRLGVSADSAAQV